MTTNFTHHQPASRVFARSGDLQASLAPLATDPSAWLVISRFQNFDTAASLDFLADLPLTALHIVDANKRDISIVQRLSRLEHLILGDTTQPLDLSALTNLRSLSLFWTKATTLPPAATPIHTLDLRHYKSPSKDFAALPLYPLHTLHLTHGNARSLEGLERYSGLRHLTLSTMMRLTSTETLAALHLASLRVEACPAIRTEPPTPARETPSHESRASESRAPEWLADESLANESPADEEASPPRSGPHPTEQEG